MAFNTRNKVCQGLPILFDTATINHVRIAYFTNFYKPTISGVVTSLTNFRRGLLAAGQEVYLFAPKYHDYDDEETYIFRFPSVHVSDELSVSLAVPIGALMEPTMLGIKPQVIHSHHPILMGDAAAMFAEKMGIPLVFTFHTQYEKYIQEFITFAPELSGKLAESMISRYLEKCDHVIAPTRSIQKLVESYEIEVPVTIIPTPIDLRLFRVIQPDRVRAKLKLVDQKILIYLGRLSPEKNLGFLLRAFARLRAVEKNILLVMVGSGPGKVMLKNQAEKLGVSEAVIFVEQVPYTEVPSYLAVADLFMFPSTTETQGLVPLEAMAAGIPVIAVDTEVNAEVLEDGGGLLVEEDEAAFANTVHQVLSNPSLRAEMRAKGLATAEKYQISSAVEHLMGVYQSVLEKRGSSHRNHHGRDHW